MKRIVTRVVVLALTALFFASCSGDSFESEHLSSGSGLWRYTRKTGSTDFTYYERFSDNGTGKVWSPNDGLTENDAQLFKWSLSGSSLTYSHYNEASGKYDGVTERFTVLELTSSTLRMKNSEGEVTNATKQ